MTITSELLKEIKFDDFVVLDLETTGLDPSHDQIIEIGAIRFFEGKVCDKFESLVNPNITIPDFITKLTGITDDDVKDAPDIDEIFDDLLQFVDDSPLIGHQINFDASFLEYRLRTQNGDFSNWEKETHRFQYLQNRRMDTLFLARIFLPFLQRFRLNTVAAYFDIDLENAHRAIEDARATGHIFLQLIERTVACNSQILQNIIRLLYKNSSRVKYYFKPILDYKTTHNIEMTSAGLSEDITYFQQHYNIIGEGDYLLEPIDAEGQLESISEERILKYLSEKGDLAQAIKNFEERSQQKEMAVQIAQAFNTSEFRIIEAGTGTGKSMAYLLPSVEWAVKNRNNHERVMISTNTKNLQEQLFFKDIPTVFSIADAKFKAVLLKGKSNYLCLDKWKATLIDMDQRLSAQERIRILPLMLWVEQTQTGDIAENVGFQLNQNWGLWSKLIAENSYCPGRVCKFYDDCFLMKARGNARKADIIVVNHSLLFSDLITDNSILGDYHNLVIDEAHNLEKVAGDYLGTRFNWWTFRNIYHKLYEEEPRQNGTLAQLEYRLSQSSSQNTVAERMIKQISRLKTEAIYFKRSTQNFFAELNSKLRHKYQKPSPNGYEETKIRYYKNFRFFSELFEMIEDLNYSLSNCKKRLSDLLDIYKEFKAETFPFQDQIHRELISIETDLEILDESFEFCITAEMDNYVYWLELPIRKDSTDVSFNAVPLNIAELLKKTLYDRLQVVILTSATLAVNESFDYYRTRIGMNLVESSQVKPALLGSPFDYENQILIAVSDFIDDPRNEQFSAQLSSLIKELHLKIPTGMLALFTNYSMLNVIYDQLRDYFESEKILFLAQGKSGSRTNIINQFRENKNSILLGTDSFWEGIDVPGEALELLLITKLPFDVPSEPLIAARMDQIRKSGGNPFLEYSVPEAIIKFRQGFGRLIRHKNDFGAVIVCDNRLSRMQYGQGFLGSLPVKAKIYRDKFSLYEDLHNWFVNKKMRAELSSKDL